jgi:exodeoxyribonuclease V alpha subunit
MNIYNGIVQICNVWPGTVGGAIFTASPINSKKTILCNVSYKTLRTTPKRGEFWKIKGRMAFDTERYMNQVAVLTCQLQGLPSNQFLSAFLNASPRFRGFGFGPKKIEKLINAIGDEGLLIKLMNENKWEHIAEVINEVAAEKLCEEWLKSKNETDTVTFLVEHDFDPCLSTKIMKLCRGNTVARLKDNPYNLLAFGGIVRGMFLTVEKCAEKLKIDKNDQRRLVGGIEHVMYERLSAGHTAITEAQLFESAMKLLGTETRAKNAIEAALRVKAICRLIDNDEVLYQAIGPAYIEYSFEKRLSQIINSRKQLSLFSVSESSVKNYIEAYNRMLVVEQGYSLVTGQVDAVLMALTNPCSIITGYGGTGKTTVLRAIVSIAEDTGQEVYMMALAGKAKERMREATGRNAMTIHGFIKAASTKNGGGKGKIVVDLDCSPFIVIDEASMVDVSLFNRLLKLFDNRSYRLLTVGDDSQLSPVGFGLAWHKMVDSEIPTTHLTEVHRQAADSPLHRIAMQIRNGKSEKLPAWNGESQGVFFVGCHKTKLRDEIVRIKLKRPKAQVLTPHMSERLPDSGIAMNNEIQSKLNFDTETKFSDARPGFRVGRHFIHEGDPVMVTENNYEIELFNGTIGKLLRMDENKEGEVVGVFEFEGCSGTVCLTLEYCYEIGLTLAYAISVHKSQGSEFNETIISCIVKSDFVERSMMYTALTRTKKLCIFVGDRNVYHDAVAALKRADTICTGLKIVSEYEL